MKDTATVCSKRSVEKKNPCALIVGASSGIGREVALLLLEKGWRVGVCCRRLERLHELADRYPGQVETEALDVCRAEAPQVLERLMERVGRIDVFYLISGVGWQNPQLDPAIELQTVATNAAGFTRMVTAAFRYFESVGGGHIAVVSSIAGTRGLGAAPAYSATKRFQNTYIEALQQQARMRRLPIRFTDVRPGFVRTDLLGQGHYPFQMSPRQVACSIVRAVSRRREVVVVDWRYAVVTFLWRLILRWIWVRISVHN